MDDKGGIRIKNWGTFQHFKDRRPPWIKLYRTLLDDPDWYELDPLLAKNLINLWLIGSETNGVLPSIKKLSFRLRISEKQVESMVSRLSHWLEQDDITPISGRYQLDAPEEIRSDEMREETDTGFSPREMMDTWNKAIDFFAEHGEVKIPKITKLSADRRRKCLSRIEDCNLDAASWKSILNLVHHDDWMSGRRPSDKYPGWCATFDYLIRKPSTIIQIIEKGAQT